MTLKTSLSICALAMPGVALAQSNPADQPPWGAGIGAAVSSRIYAGEDARITPFPLITYQGDRWFWRGIGGGFHLVKGESVRLDATLSARFAGVDRKDFGRRDLAQRGINRDLLSKRDDSADVGLAASWRTQLVDVSASAKVDATGASEGYELALKLGHRFSWGAPSLTPSIGLVHQSKKFSNYYFGTSGKEVRRGVVDYQPGSATMPRAELEVVYPFAGQWAVIGNLSYTSFPDKIQNSPLVDKDANGVTSAFVGVSRRF